MQVPQSYSGSCCRANSAQIRQPRPDSGLDLGHVQAKVFKILKVVPFSFGSGLAVSGDTTRSRTNVKGFEDFNLQVEASASSLDSAPLDAGHLRREGTTPVLISEALLAHDVCVCLERPSGALPPESGVNGNVGVH